MELLNKYKLPLAISGLALGAAAIIGGHSVLAAEQGTYPPIVQRIADHFNLNTTDVQQVFDEQRNANLNQAVTDGKITQAQRDLIQAKHDEMVAQMEKLKDLTPTERRDQMRTLHEDMRAWAEQTGIDLPAIIGGHMGLGGERIGGMHRMGGGHGFGHGMMDLEEN